MVSAMQPHLRASVMPATQERTVQSALVSATRQPLLPTSAPVLQQATLRRFAAVLVWSTVRVHAVTQVKLLANF